MSVASRTRFRNLVIELSAAVIAALLLGLALFPRAAHGQGVYVPDDSRIQSVDPGNPSSGQGAPPNADNPTVKSLGTIPIEPGGTPTHPYIPDDDSDSGDRGNLNANHVAYGEAAANAYKAKNFSEARTLWQQAAKGGDIDALYALGVMNERGEGGPKDLEQALGWYSAAQQKGVGQASAKVAAITEQLRQEAAAAETANKAAEAAQESADKAAAQDAAKADAARAAAVKKKAQDDAAATTARAKAQAEADAKAKAQADAPPPSPPPQVTREAPPPAPAPQTTVEPTPAPAPQGGNPPTQLQPQAKSSQPPSETAAADPGATRLPAAHDDSGVSAEDAFTRATAAAAGRGVKKDDAEAAKWFRVAADKGYAPAQNDLGFFYAEGRGVKKDDTEAVKWYQRAADQNYAPGQMSLGMMYAAGRGVAQSDFDALALYSTAANQGYAPATANLAQAYAEGRGIEKDERTGAFLASSVNEKPRKGSGIYVDSGS